MEERWETKGERIREWERGEKRRAKECENRRETGQTKVEEVREWKREKWK